jgi:hypothetical protein
MQKGYLFRILVIAGMFAGIISCKTTERLNIEAVPDKKTMPAELSVLESRTKRDFTTLKLRNIEGKINVNGVSENVKGNMAFYRDSLIVISVVPALGYELARILCTPDSIIIINRNEKTYIASSFERYSRMNRIPITFHDIQAILYNEIFYYKNNILERSYIEYADTVDGMTDYIMESYMKGRKMTLQKFEFNREGSYLNGTYITDYENRIKVDLKYDEFVFEGYTVFPKKIVFNLFEPGNTLDLEISFGRVVINDPLNVDFSIPSNYTRTEI